MEEEEGVCEKPATSPKVAFHSVCYPYVGCFDDKPPFNNAAGELPKSPEELAVEFRLYTRVYGDGKTLEQLDYRNASSVTASHFDPSKPVKFVIHGFFNSANSPWIAEMKDALLSRGDFNAITVNWGKGAQPPNYNQAVANLRLVGTQVKLLLDIMVDQGADLAQVHIIGHSLGAHMAGYVGLLHGSKIGRISGLDPAEPDFECLPTLIRLDPGDATFVDVIHTNGEPLVEGGAGLFQQCGDVDFYVNGGKTQPGCKDGIGGALSNLFSHGASAAGDGVSCSHSRSHAIFTESILTHCPFTGFPCDNYDKFTSGQCMSCGPNGCSSMGYFADEYYTKGRLFLKTSETSPFCGFHYAIKIETSDTTKSTKGTMYASLQGVYGSSDFVAVTPQDDNLTPSDTIQRVVVVQQNVGRVKSLLLKYKQFGGYGLGSFRFGKGESNFSVQKAHVMAGDTGVSFEFDFGQYDLHHDEEQMLPVKS